MLSLPPNGMPTEHCMPRGCAASLLGAEASWPSPGILPHCVQSAAVRHPPAGNPGARLVTEAAGCTWACPAWPADPPPLRLAKGAARRSGDGRFPLPSRSRPARRRARVLGPMLLGAAIGGEIGRTRAGLRLRLALCAAIVVLGCSDRRAGGWLPPVSYTHLTLPTILRV